MNTSSSSIQLWLKPIMADSILSVNSTVPAYEAAKLIEESPVSAIIVLENQVPAGIVTHRDLTIKIIAHSYPSDTPIRRIMSSPLISITPQTDIQTAAELMASKKIRKLPIIENDEVKGMVIASEIRYAEN